MDKASCSYHTLWNSFKRVAQVSKNDEFCTSIQNEESCILNEELCTANDDLSDARALGRREGGRVLRHGGAGLLARDGGVRTHLH